MNIPDIRAQIEAELTWRAEELKFLKNQMSYINKEEEKEKYRKALIVMLYSHYEGFCKNSFIIYINEINKENILRAEANYVILTASMQDIFKAYDSNDKKSKIFKRELPNDEKLHKFSRQVDFIESMNAFESEELKIPEAIVDTEANLKPVVLKKLLFRLGFQHDSFSANDKFINLLLNKRNNIAHGAEKEGVSEGEYQEIEDATYSIMEELMKLIINALENKSFLKENA